MEAVFLKLLNMSIAASWLVLAIVLLRVLLRKAPKAIHCMLWALVAVRLLCPFSLESALSLVPSAETVPPEILYSPAPEIHSGISAVNRVVNPLLSESFAPEGLVSVNPMQIIVFIASNLWAMGVVVLLLYAAISFFRVRTRVQTAVWLEADVWQSEQVDSPFILGIFRPRIYLPFDMKPEQRQHVIAHERAHLSRHDHWWKPLGFLLLSVYWFNPLMWVAYILLCRDIELACDEKVIQNMDLPEKKAYSHALLSCSMPRHMIAACPLAFGEVGVKTRIKSVLSYKKPGFWIVVAAVAACAAVAVCFLTDPQENPENLPTLEQTYLAVSTKGEAFDIGLTGHPRERLIELWGEPDGTLSGFWGDIWELKDLASVIVYYDADGIIEHVKVDEQDDEGTSNAQATPVSWTFSPMTSATWHVAFHFSFDFEYTHIDASCEEGVLWNFYEEGQPRERTMRFEAGSPVCWAPLVGDSLSETSEGTTVRFTVYDGVTELYSGCFAITRTGAEGGQTFYEAQLMGCAGLYLLQSDGNGGGSVVTAETYAAMTAQDTVIWSDADLDHDGTKETIHVREVAAGQLYELSVVKADGTVLWSTEAATAHVGWNTILLHQSEGKDYLVRYLPVMFQGVGSYVCMQFSLENGRQTVQKSINVDFELPVQRTEEMNRFAEDVNALLENSVVLLSTEQGELVMGPGAAAEVPQLYPVHFDPNEIWADISSSAEENS